MLEVMIEQWNNLDGSTDYLWSLWRDGRRVHMGGTHASAAAAEAAARAFCRDRLGAEPNAVTRL